MSHQSLTENSLREMRSKAQTIMVRGARVAKVVALKQGGRRESAFAFADVGVEVLQCLLVLVKIVRFITLLLFISFDDSTWGKSLPSIRKTEQILCLVGGGEGGGSPSWSTAGITVWASEDTTFCEVACRACMEWAVLRTVVLRFRKFRCTR